MEVLKLIEELEDLIEESSSVPFGGKVLLDKKEALEIIKEIRINLPDEVKQAEWINSERQRILAQAQQESDSMIQNTKSYIQEQVENSQLLKEAQKQAQDIIEEAQQVARQVKMGSLDYADDILEKVQLVLTKNIEMIEQNRSELKQ